MDMCIVKYVINGIIIIVSYSLDDEQQSYSYEMFIKVNVSVQK